MWMRFYKEWKGGKNYKRKKNMNGNWKNEIRIKLETVVKYERNEEKGWKCERN